LSNVRLQFSGIMRFAVIIFSLFTGLVFTTLITRNLSIEEYGQWSAIGSLIGYGTFPVLGLGYWFTRYTARKISVARTGLMFSLIFSLIGTVIFFLTALIFLPNFVILTGVLSFAVLQVITYSIVNSLTAIGNGKNPVIAAYSMFGFEIAKVGIVLLAVYLTDFKLIEAIIVIILAQIVQIGIFLILLKKEIMFKTDLKYIIKIIKTIWIPYYNKFPGVIFGSDILIITLMTSSFPQIAIFRIAMIFSTIIEYGSQLTYPLYIKLLGGGQKDDVFITTRLLMLFTIPISMGIFILAKPLLYLLNPEYIISEKILQILVFYSVTMVISSIFDNIILGMEKVDVMEKVEHRKLLYSGLFKLPSINFVRIVSYILSLSLFTIFFWNEKMPLEQFGEIWALILLITSIPIMIYKWNVARKIIVIKSPWKNILKYIFASIIMSIIIFILSESLSYEPEIMSFFPQLLLILIISMGVYFGILIIIDKETREIIKNINKLFS
jgi:O-antigen/teichoic acid export membrane protein